MTNGAYGSRSHGGRKSYIDDTIRYGRFLDMPDRRHSGLGFYSSYGSDRYHGQHCYHACRGSDRGYLSHDFKKSKPPTFDGEMKN